jgi:hypothetical protein
MRRIEQAVAVDYRKSCPVDALVCNDSETCPRADDGRRKT